VSDIERFSPPGVPRHERKRTMSTIHSRRLLAMPLSAAMALSATLALAAASPAAADSSCQNGKLCLWNQPNFTGNKQTEGPLNFECTGITLTGGAQSAKNASTRTILVFTGTNCNGTLTATLLPDSQNASFTPSHSYLVTVG
jgi:hypothetical protein